MCKHKNTNDYGELARIVDSTYTSVLVVLSRKLYDKVRLNNGMMRTCLFECIFTKKKKSANAGIPFIDYLLDVGVTKTEIANSVGYTKPVLYAPTMSERLSSRLFKVYKKHIPGFVKSEFNYNKVYEDYKYCIDLRKRIQGKDTIAT